MDITSYLKEQATEEMSGYLEYQELATKLEEKGVSESVVKLVESMAEDEYRHSEILERIRRKYFD